MTRVEARVAALLKQPEAVRAVVANKEVVTAVAARLVRSAASQKALLNKIIVKPAGLRTILRNPKVQHAAQDDALMGLSRLFAQYSMEDIQLLASEGKLHTVMPVFSSDTPVGALTKADLVPLDFDAENESTRQMRYADYISQLTR